MLLGSFTPTYAWQQCGVHTSERQVRTRLPALLQKMRGFCLGKATLSGECSGTWELLLIAQVKMGSLQAF